MRSASARISLLARGALSVPRSSHSLKFICIDHPRVKLIISKALKSGFVVGSTGMDLQLFKNGRKIHFL